MRGAARTLQGVPAAEAAGIPSPHRQGDPMLFGRTPRLPTPEQALGGRPALAFEVPERHTVLGTRLLGPYPEGLEIADFGLGCFWGAERKF